MTTVQLPKQALPTGIRKRGNSYQYIVTHEGKQYSGTADTLEGAIAERKNMAYLLTKNNPPTIPKAESIAVPSSSKLRIPRNMSMQEAVNKAYGLRWEDTKAERTSMLNANSLIKYFGKTTPVSNITTEAVHDLVISLKQQGLSNATINRKLSCLSVILKIAEDCGATTASPNLSRRKEYKGRERFLTEKEEQDAIALLSSWGKDDHRDAFIVLLDTGMRTGELFKLQAKDADFKQGKYGILTLWRTKNDLPRSVPMTYRVSSIVEERVNACKNSNEPIFNFNQWWLRSTWDRLKSNLGLTNDSQFVPHILRHTCASRLVQRGVPLLMVQKWLGHESLQSTMRYSHLSPEALFNVVEDA